MLKKVLVTILTGSMVMGCLTACGSKPVEEKSSEVVEVSVEKSEEGTEEVKGEPTNLILFNVTDELKPDHDLVWDKINEILMEKLNVTVEYRNITWAEYYSKYPMLISSGEQIDILYCMNGSWQDYVGKGAFMDLTDLAPKYAPNLYGALSEDQIAAASMDGKLWTLPPNYMVCAINGIAVRGDLMDKYGIGDITTHDDFVEYLKVVYENEESFALFADGTTGYLMDYSDEWSAVSGTENLLFFDSSNGADHSILKFPWEREGYVEFLHVMEEVYNAGVVPKDVMMSDVKSQDAFVEGIMPAAVVNNNNFSNAVWGKIMSENPDWDPRWYYFGPEEQRVVSPISNGWVIPATAQNPELSLAVMDILAMDKELHDLVNYGIEGIHYVVTENGEADLPEGVTNETVGYASYGTIHMNGDYKMNTVGTWPEYNAILATYFENGHISPINGFVADTTNVSVELANMSAIMSEYGSSLTFGVLPVDETIEELKTAMEAAGCEKVREEISAQIKAFVAE